jgi:hypothetical protein
MIEGHLFRKGVSISLLKCIGPDEVGNVLAEIHEGSCGHHIGAKSLVRKAFRAGYFWPTMQEDATNHIKKCEQCQRHATIPHIPPEELHTLSVSWPFHTWGMDILGPFHKATGQLKHLLVVVDYFTKWVEAEPLATIMSARVESFTFKTIICRFGIQAAIVTHNGTQSIGSAFKDLLQGLQIRHHCSSVEHPKTNGQAEAANKVILNGLRK